MILPLFIESKSWQYSSSSEFLFFRIIQYRGIFFFFFFKLDIAFLGSRGLKHQYLDPMDVLVRAGAKEQTVESAKDLLGNIGNVDSQEQILIRSGL